MGYQKASAYQTLFELTFAEGKLVSTQDLSSSVPSIKGTLERYAE
jgi:hypothetical protein